MFIPQKSRVMGLDFITLLKNNCFKQSKDFFERILKYFIIRLFIILLSIV